MYTLHCSLICSHATSHLPQAFSWWCSGNTADHPGLLQYACRLTTNIRPSPAARVHTTGVASEDDMEVMAGVLGGRPVLALCFEDMEVTCCGYVWNSTASFNNNIGFVRTYLRIVGRRPTIVT